MEGLEAEMNEGAWCEISKGPIKKKMNNLKVNTYINKRVIRK